VLPEGYNPAHFSVKKGLPVRLIFRQLGQVGCGDELIFTWAKGKSTDLKLASATDKQVLEFTPQETGDFQFNCPHHLYIGAMTVVD
jgi:plastocyanin domain-containing protein